MVKKKELHLTNWPANKAHPLEIQDANVDNAVLGPPPDHEIHDGTDVAAV